MRILNKTASKERIIPVRLFFMHRPVQRKYAAKAAHGSRGE